MCRELGLFSIRYLLGNILGIIGTFLRLTFLCLFNILYRISGLIGFRIFFIEDQVYFYMENSVKLKIDKTYCIDKIQ